MSSSKVFPPCNITYGRLADEEFNSPEYCLLVSQNCVTYRNFGCTADIVQRYPYSDVAGLRTPDPYRKAYAIQEHRGVEGRALIKTPETGAEGPTVATLLTQFGIGRAIEDNNISQKIVLYCQEKEISSRLNQDTKERRIIYFKKGICQLSKLPQDARYNKVRHIIVPVGIGMSGVVNDLWLKKYLPIIYAFSHLMEQCQKCGYFHK